MDKTPVAAKLDAVANALQIQNFVDKIDEENLKLSKAEIKETKELVSALKSLQKRIGDIGKEDSPATKNLSSWFKEKMDPIKKLTSLQGITETLAKKAGPGFTGALLGTAAEGMQIRKEEKQRKASFVTSVLEGTEVGRAWQKEHGVEKAAQLATNVYKERESLEKQISVLDQKEKLIQGDGSVEGAGLDEKDSLARENLRKQLDENKKFFLPKKDATEASEPNVLKEVTKTEQPTSQIREELMRGVREGLQQEYENLSPEERAEFDKNPEERAIMIEAAMRELSKISEDQLRELVRIADSLDDNELEDKEKLLETVEEKALTLESPEEKKSPMKSLLEKGMSLFRTGFKGLTSVFSKGLSFLTGGLTKLIGPIASMLPSLMSSLAPAAGVAAAGAAGYMVGKHVVNPALNKAAEAITGVEGETVGTGIYTAVDNLAGSKLGNMIGFKSDAQKMEESETRALVEMGNAKIAKGEKVSPTIAKAMVKSGIPVLADQIAEQPSKQETRAQITEAVERNADQISVQPTKQETRAQITEAVERTADQIDNGPASKASPSIVNAPTVVNNSTSNTTITHKPLRNTEPSYVSGMNRKLVF